MSRIRVIRCVAYDCPAISARKNSTAAIRRCGVSRIHSLPSVRSESNVRMCGFVRINRNSVSDLCWFIACMWLVLQIGSPIATLHAFPPAIPNRGCPPAAPIRNRCFPAGGMQNGHAGTAIAITDRMGDVTEVGRHRARDDVCALGHRMSRSCPMG